MRSAKKREILRKQIMKFYPVNLNIKGKVCLIAGGGKVAERKIKNILFCGGKVKVISPELTSKLAEMAGQGKIDYIKGEYEPGILKGAYLVYAAVSDRRINAKIARDAKKINILVNVCDSAGKSSFILPALLRKDGINFAVSTDGSSPEKAVKMKNKLKEVI